MAQVALQLSTGSKRNGGLELGRGRGWYEQRTVVRRGTARQNGGVYGLYGVLDPFTSRMHSMTCAWHGATCNSAHCAAALCCNCMHCCCVSRLVQLNLHTLDAISLTSLLASRLLLSPQCTPTLVVIPPYLLTSAQTDRRPLPFQKHWFAEPYCCAVVILILSSSLLQSQSAQRKFSSA